MREQQTREIDGLRFTVQMLPAMRATRLWHRILKGAAPAFLKAAGSAKSGLADADVSALADAAQLLFNNFSESDFEGILRELLETTLVEKDGKQFPLMPVFDDLMRGRTVTLLKLVRFALEVNYSDFFDGLRGKLGSLTAARSAE